MKQEMHHIIHKTSNIMSNNLAPKHPESNSAAIQEYISPRQLAIRWDCSRTSAQRIVDRAGISKYYLGEGKNGLVRYSIKEIQAYEISRCTSTHFGC